MQFDFTTETITPDETNILTIKGDAVELPFGSTTTRPLSATTGALRFNTDTMRFEGFHDTTWIPFSDWSIVSNRPTTLSGYGITDAVSNSLGTPGIIQDTFANRPLAGTVGRVFIDTTNNLLQRDTGTGWVTIGAAGSVSSVAAAAPSAGFTISGSPITSSGTLTFTLSDDLAALENISTTGVAIRTNTDTWTTRSLVAPSAGFTITNPAGISGNITFSLSDDLAALENLSSTGLAIRTGTSTWTVRSIQGTTDQIALSNGDGVSGNPIISISANPILPGTGSVTLPSGTSAQRPVSPTAGMVRYNSTTGDYEYYHPSRGWEQHVDESVLFDTKEPTGFIDRTSSTISFNNGTRTFTIAPTGASYDYFYRGRRVTKSVTDSIVIPDTEGNYYIFFDAADTLQFASTPPDFSINVLVSYLYWNATDDRTELFADERHGATMDGATHRYLHFSRGYQWISGTEIGNFTTTGDGTSNSHAQFSLTNGRFFDEDIQIDITNATTPTAQYEQTLSPIAKCRIAWLSGTSGVFRSTTTPQDYPVILDTVRIFFNEFSGGSWIRTQASEGYYVAAWVFASNATLNPVGILMGQRQDATQNDAEINNKLDTLNLSIFNIPEVKPLYRLLFQTSSTYTNAVKARLVKVDDLRLVQTAFVGIAAGTQIHGELSGLESDDHLQYMHIDNARTVTARHTFNPGTAASPFILGTNAQGQLVTGLNSDLLDGLDSTAFQPVDSDLTALANTTTTGVYVRTGTGTSATRTITGTVGNITITNGDGVAGNPTINLDTVGTAGTYGSVTTDAFGRVTSGSVISPVTNGGTGLGSIGTANQVLGVNTGGTALEYKTITAGTGITITPSAGTITVAGNTGTVTSVAATAPAAGFTITGSPITTSGTLTFALSDDLAAVEGLTTTGIAIRTGTSTWTTRSLTAPAAGITITNPDGVAGSPTLALANDLAAVEGLATTGFGVRTGADAWATRSLTAPAAGITISNNDGVAGNPTFALSNDLAAVESLSTNGITVRTGTDTWTTRTIAGTTNQITVTNRDGIAGNPTLSVPSTFVAPGSVQATTWLYESLTTGITAAGATQGTAIALTTVYNVVTTVAAGTGVILPTPVSPFGQKVVITNRGANPLNVYPNTGAAIANGATNAAISLPVNQEVTLFSASATQWWVQEPVIVAGTNITITPGAGTLTIASTGGGTPAAPTNSIQFNNAGAFGGSANNTWDNTNNIQTINGAAATNRLTINTDTAIPIDTAQRANAAVYIQVNGDATFEGQRVYFRRSSAGTSGWITYNYDQNTPNLRLIDEDDDSPYIAFQTIGTGTFDLPLYTSVFGARGANGTRTLGNESGFAWSIGSGVTAQSLYAGVGYAPVMELDSQWLRVPAGTTAQRPATPENGMIRYNSTARAIEYYQPNVWVRTTGLIEKLTTSATLTGTGENDLINYTVSGGTLGTDGVIRIIVQGTVNNTSGATRTFTIRVRYGATTIYADTTGTLATGATAGLTINLFLMANNATNAQSLTGNITIGNTGGVTTGITGDLGSATVLANAVIAATSAVDSTVNRALRVTIQASAGSTTTTRYIGMLELL